MHGTLVVISSPSGGGKNSVINALMNHFPDSTRLVTTTTRSMRPGEQDGVDYYFINKATFEEKLRQGDFLEYNIYAAGHYYGTERARLQYLLEQHRLVFSQIEVNGKHQLDRAHIPHLSIFLLPESLAMLRERIEKRGGLTADVIDERLAIAETELEASKDYDHRLVNKEGHIDETVEKIRQIIEQNLGSRA